MWEWEVAEADLVISLNEFHATGAWVTSFGVVSTVHSSYFKALRVGLVRFRLKWFRIITFRCTPIGFMLAAYADLGLARFGVILSDMTNTRVRI